MAYRFPGDGPFTGKKGHEAHARDYGDAAGEAYHEVRQRFFPEEIDEVAALLVNERRRREMRADLAEVHRMVDCPGAADRAAREVLSLVGSPVPAPSTLRPGR